MATTEDKEDFLRTVEALARCIERETVKDPEKGRALANRALATIRNAVVGAGLPVPENLRDLTV